MAWINSGVPAQRFVENRHHGRSSDTCRTTFDIDTIGVEASRVVELEVARRKARLWPFSAAIAVVLGVGASLTVGVFVALLAMMGSPAVDHPSSISVSDLVGGWRLALFVTAGVGGVVGLLVAYRRQRVAEAGHELHQRAQEFDERMRSSAQALQEKIAADNQRDAAEKSVTELYSSGVNQLGSEKASVRMGALYALERLAQAHPRFRQTVVDVLCAYLRLPHRPKGFRPYRPDHRTPAELAAAVEEQHVRGAIQDVLHRHLVPTGTDLDYREPDSDLDWSDSRIRRIYENYGHGLLAHDRDREGEFWEGMHLNLQHATLAYLSLRGARAASVDFRNANLIECDFDGLVVERDATFVRSRFHGPVRFTRCQFQNGAYFHRARFRAGVQFVRTTFASTADFVDASFSGLASFSHCIFADGHFDGATFRGNANFRNSAFSEVDFGIAAFWYHSIPRHGAQFRAEACFDGAKFKGRAIFQRNRFARPPTFHKARFDSDGIRRWPAGYSDGPENTIVTAGPQDRRTAGPQDRRTEGRQGNESSVRCSG